MIYNVFTHYHGILSAALLPLAGLARGSCGSIFSACLGALFLLPSGPASAAPSATQQIETSITAAIGKQIDSEAKRQGLQALRHTVQITHIGNSEQLSACSQALRISTDTTAAIDARQRIQMQCPDSPGWTHNAWAQPSVFLQAVHAATLIDRGTTLSSSQLTLTEVELGKASRGFFQDIEDVSGQGAKRRIRPGQLITPALISAPLMVRRGQPVTIRASHDGINAATKGQALSNGKVGDVIRVRNLSSEKVIEAQVLEPGVVTSTFR